MKFLLVILLLIESVFFCQAQYREVKHFTMADGLPTNSIYNCVEDNQGFLWIATDQGVIRFDGKQFQRFTTEQGLPDNEILKVMKEGNGRIWIHSFKQTPAYFDEVKNKFINANDDSLLKNISSKRLLFCYNTMGEGMEFYSESGTSLFSNNHKYEYSPSFQNNFGLLIKRINAENCISIVMKLDTKRLMLYHIYKNTIKDQRDLGVTGGSIFFNNIFIHQNKVYCLVSQKENNNIYQFVCLSDIKTYPLTFKMDTMRIQKTLSQISITKHYVIVSYNAENKFEVYDVSTKKWVQTFHTNYAVNSVFEDTNGSLWVCTVDKGLIQLKQTLIQRKEITVGLNEVPYLSISEHQGSLYMGTTANQIIESINGVSVIHDLPANSDLYGWQRDILFSGKKIFSFSDAGSYINYKHPILAPVTHNPINAKAAILLNDSMILCGTHALFYRINTHTESVEELNNQDIRITSMVKYNSSLIYYGSTDGLHKYDVVQKENLAYEKTNPLLHERVVSLCMNSDSIVWVATAGNGIIAVRHDSVISHISNRQGLNTNSVRTIATGKSKQLFVGTNEGISIIDYTASIRYPSIKNISVSDGLSSNCINRILYLNDSVYVATNSGVSILPADISIPTFDIPIKIIGIQINQHDTSILNHYELKSNQYTINLHIAGIELNGHFKNAQLSLDKGITWANIEGNEISLQLNNGSHHVWIRSIDVNRNISKQVLKLQIDIATPFYKAWWFWLCLGIIVLAGSINANTQFTKRKQQYKIEGLLHQRELDELEIQALKSQINPHFVFNCMNSIQGFIYDEDFENADTYLRKFSDILRSTLHYSSQESISLQAELEYIQTYIDLEKLRFGNKVNFSIQISMEVRAKELNIPAMLLQPFIENAINHGIYHLKERSGEIVIKLYIVTEFLHIEIDDNGIGREAANKLKQEGKNKHESKGSQLTKRRLELYKIHIDMIDKKDVDGNDTGTKIHLIIPIPLIT